MASQENEDGQKSNQDKVRQLEWLLDKNIQTTTEAKDPYKPYYGDVTELNTCRLIMDSVGKETLKDISEDAIDLLDTSVAIYEANGDYAFGMFSSGWCRLMDAASRELCQTDDNRKALDGGRWLCHENCWNDSATPAIESGQSTDIKCVGGINLYAEPIYAGGCIVGVINIGYENPPKEVEQLKELAETFSIDFKRLNERANSYYPRPKFLVSLAKKRLRSAAKLIGEIVEKAQIEKLLKAQEERLQLVIKGSNDAPWDWDLISNELYYSPQWWRQLGYTPNELPVDVALWERLMHPEDSEHVDSVFWGALKSGTESYEVELRLLHKEGHYVPVLSRGFITRDETGNPIRVTGSNMDLSERKKAEEALRESEAKYRRVADNSPAVLYQFMMTPDGAFSFPYVSDLVMTVMGIPSEDVMKDPAKLLGMVHPEDQEMFREGIMKSAESLESFPLTFRCLKDGEVIWIESRGMPTPLTDGGMLWDGFLLDITEQKQAEEALRESEKKYHTLFEDSPISLWEEDFSAVKSFIDNLRDKGINDFRTCFEEHPEDLAHCVSMVKIVDINKTTLDMYQVETKKEFLKGLSQFLTEESYALFKEEILSLCAGNTSFEGEAITQTATGEIKYIYMKCSLAHGFEETWSKILVSIADVTDRKQAEEQIKSSLKEKEILLSEIHHRVKNNMQIIISLLRLQAGKINDKQHADIFKEAEDRIRSMALIHETLYQTKDFANVNFNDYVKTISNYLFRNYGVSPDKVGLKIEIEDISLGLDNAIPCGLIINELISNALKYAFPKDRIGEIKITFRSMNQDEIELMVSDDGIGLPEGIDIGKLDSMGLQLVNMLAENQLEGRIDLNRDGGGSEFRIRFTN